MFDMLQTSILDPLGKLTALLGKLTAPLVKSIVNFREHIFPTMLAPCSSVFCWFWMGVFLDGLVLDGLVGLREALRIWKRKNQVFGCLLGELWIISVSFLLNSGNHTSTVFVIPERRPRPSRDRIIEQRS